jgi:Ca2+-binding RTX toxin-like protein
MRFSIGLGRTGSSTQWYLPGTDIARLPSRPGDAPPPVAGALEELATSVDGTDALLGGLVGVSGGPDADADGPGLVLDVLGAWNSVKNGSFLADGAARITLSGFVHADVALGDGGDSSVVLRGAKRGNVLTGGGDDEVAIEPRPTPTAGSTSSAWPRAAATTWWWSARSTSRRRRPVATPPSPPRPTAPGPSPARTRARWCSRRWAPGTTCSSPSGKARTACRGGRRRHPPGRRRADVLAGGAGDDVFFFAAGDGADTVLDFRPGADRLGFGLGQAQARALLDAAVEADGATTISYGAGSVLLLGVSKSQLTVDDLM